MDYKFYNIKEAPFKIYGLYNPKNEENFKRMPQSVACTVSEIVKGYNNTATGGRIRFKTNSSKIALRAVYTEEQKYYNSWDACFSLYERVNGKEVFVNSLRADWFDITEKGELFAELDLKTEKTRELTVYFPQFGYIKEVEIGILEGATLSEHSEYANTTPLVFYVSSITHGCNASRAGNDYVARVCRRFDTDFINLGFAGGAKAENEIIDYINTLDMSAFVFDYDHNTPSPEHLANTHLKAYKKIRESHPNIPIVLASKPDIDIFDDVQIERRCIIQKTYRYGIEQGDKNLYYIDGYSFFQGEERDSCTSDGVHPNDLGFFRMATAMYNVLFDAFRR